MFFFRGARPSSPASFDRGDRDVPVPGRNYHYSSLGATLAVAGEVTGSVVWRGGMAFEATAGTGGSLTIDAASDIGGAELGPGPMELLLLGLAGCTGMSVLSLLRRSTGKVVDYRIATRGRQREAHPRIFTTIAVEHSVRGRGLTAGEVERAVTLAATRFCPAAAMLGEVADIAETWILIDDESGEVVGRGE